MLKFLFLVPLVLLLLWTLYLQANGYSLKQGMATYKAILAISTVVAAFYVVLMVLTGSI